MPIMGHAIPSDIMNGIKVGADSLTTGAALSGGIAGFEALAAGGAAMAAGPALLAAAGVTAGVATFGLLATGGLISLTSGLGAGYKMYSSALGTNSFWSPPSLRDLLISESPSIVEHIADSLYDRYENNRYGYEKTKGEKDYLDWRDDWEKAKKSWDANSGGAGDKSLARSTASKPNNSTGASTDKSDHANGSGGNKGVTHDYEKGSGKYGNIC